MCDGAPLASSWIGALCLMPSERLRCVRRQHTTYIHKRRRFSYWFLFVACLSRVHVYASWTRWRQCSIDFNFPTLAFRVDSPVFSTKLKPNLWHTETKSRPVRLTRLLSEWISEKRSEFNHPAVNWIRRNAWVFQFHHYCDDESTKRQRAYILSLANRNGPAKARQTWRTPKCTTYFTFCCSASLKWMFWFVDRRRVDRIFRRTQVLH